MDHPIRTFENQTPIIGKRVFVDRLATVIGNVRLGDDVSVWPGAVIRGDMHRIKIGHRTCIQDNAVLHITHASEFNEDGWPLDLGDDVIVGHGAILHGCIFKNEVFIGIGAIIFDGAVVDKHTIVGAGALVPPGKTLEAGYVYVGNPCKKLRNITEKERAFFKYSASNYVNLKNKYIKGFG